MSVLCGADELLPCRPKPVVKLKQPLAAVKTTSVKTESPAAALNAAWANFPMPGDFMSEDLGSLPQGMDWLNSADLMVRSLSSDTRYSTSFLKP